MQTTSMSIGGHPPAYREEGAVKRGLHACPRLLHAVCPPYVLHTEMGEIQLLGPTRYQEVRRQSLSLTLHGAARGTSPPNGRQPAVVGQAPGKHLLVFGCRGTVCVGIHKPMPACIMLGVRDIERCLVALPTCFFCLLATLASFWARRLPFGARRTLSERKEEDCVGESGTMGGDHPQLWERARPEPSS